MRPKNPEKWDYYDPDEFYYATTQEALDKAKTNKFDKNFFNFEDPEVLYNFLDPKKKSIWKKTYGIDYVNMEHMPENPLEKTYVECERTRRKSKFAQNCRIDGGFFNCCLKRTSLGEFLEIRQNLTKEKLIEETVWDRELEKSDFKGSVYSLTYSCAQYNELTGDTEVRTRTKGVNTLGGMKITTSCGQQLRLGWHQIFCWTFNMCATTEIFPANFALTSSRASFCEQEAKLTTTAWYDPAAIEYIEDCKKRKSLVRLCPKDALKALNTTGRINLGFKTIHDGINNNLKPLLKEMKAKLKRSRRRKKKMKGKKEKKSKKRKGKKRNKSTSSNQKSKSSESSD